MSAGSWQVTVTTDEEIALAAEAAALDAEFDAFRVTTCATWDGPALQARRLDRTAPGLTAVITADPDEMRAVLEQGSPPDSG